MNNAKAIELLKSSLGFHDKAIKKLIIFHDYLLKWNSRYNLISKSTEDQIWSRHILDSAQLVKFIGIKRASISDFGSGAGFPGLILAIYYENHGFHVKLVEKSPIKLSLIHI